MKGIAVIEWEIYDDYYTEDPLRLKDCKKIIDWMQHSDDFAKIRVCYIKEVNDD